MAIGLRRKDTGTAVAGNWMGNLAVAAAGRLAAATGRSAAAVAIAAAGGCCTCWEVEGATVVGRGLEGSPKKNETINYVHFLPIGQKLSSPVTFDYAGLFAAAVAAGERGDSRSWSSSRLHRRLS